MVYIYHKFKVKKVDFDVKNVDFYGPTIKKGAIKPY